MSDDRRGARGDRRADEIERDLEDTREQLSDDLEDLRRRVGPERLKRDAVDTMDDAKEAAMERMEQARHEAMDRTEAAGGRLVEGVRENPMPVALVLGALGAGYALMQASRRGGSEHRGSDDYAIGDVRMDRDAMDEAGSAGTYGYRDGRGDGDESFMQKNAVLVGIGALAAGAVVGTLVTTSPETVRKGRERIGEATSKIGRRFTGDGGDGIRVRERVRVNRSPDELYSFWRDLENLPKVMSHLEDVSTIDGKRSHWKAKGPLQTSVEWDAEITEERPNDTIAWRAVEDADVPNEGVVKFRRVGPNSTDVTVSLTYHPPGGPVGEKVAKLFGEEPSQQLSDDLERFKEEVEAGRMSLGGGPGGPGATRGGPTI